eukprot:403363146
MNNKKYIIQGVQQSQPFRDQLILDLNSLVQAITKIGVIDIVQEVMDDEIILNSELSQELLLKIKQYLSDNPKYKQLSFIQREVQQRARVISQQNNTSSMNDRSDTLQTMGSGIGLLQIDKNGGLRKKSQIDEYQATSQEQEIFEDLGLTQERRRIAIRSKDYHINREDVLNTKVQAFKSSLKIWINDQRAQSQKKSYHNSASQGGMWLRNVKPNQNNFFERIQNTHLLPPLLGIFIVLVFILSLIS